MYVCVYVYMCVCVCVCVHVCMHTCVYVCPNYKSLCCLCEIDAITLNGMSPITKAMLCFSKLLLSPIYYLIVSETSTVYV